MQFMLVSLYCIVSVMRNTEYGNEECEGVPNTHWWRNVCTHELTLSKIEDMQFASPALICAPSVDHELLVEAEDTTPGCLLRGLRRLACGYQFPALKRGEIDPVKRVESRRIGVNVCPPCVGIGDLSFSGGTHAVQTVGIGPA